MNTGVERQQRARSLAIDRELIVQELWGSLTTVPPDYMFPGAFGHDPAFSGFPYDPEAARELVAGSEYDDAPINFQATAGYYANTDLIMPVMAQMWEDIGLNINYKPMESSAFLDLYFAGDIMMREGSKVVFGEGIEVVRQFSFEFLSHEEDRLLQVNALQAARIGVFDDGEQDILPVNA